MTIPGFIDLTKTDKNTENVWWFTVGSFCKKATAKEEQTKAHTIHILLSEAALKWQKSFQTSHDMIALLLKRTRVSSGRADFPMPSANRRPHKIHFSALMSEVLFAGSYSYFIFFDFFSPSTVCFISIHRAYPHSQTYFRSKLTQLVEALYPNMGSGISLCFLCPPVCIARMIS